MKKIFLCLLILLMFLVFALLGCRADITEEVDEMEEDEEISEEEVAEESEKELSEEVTNEDREEKPSFTSDDGKVEFILDNVERTKVLPDDAIKITELHQIKSVPKEGNDFIIINFTITHITDGHIDLSHLINDSTLIDNNEDEVYLFLFTFQGASLYDKHDVNSGMEFPEGSQGTIIFEILENSQPVKFKLAYTFFESWSETGEYQSEEERYIDIILN